MKSTNGLHKTNTIDKLRKISSFTFRSEALDFFEESTQGGVSLGLNAFELLMASSKARGEYMLKYGYAILGEEALEAIVGLEVDIIEVGAGRAYWAAELSKRGVDVIATDYVPHGENKFAPQEPYMEIGIADAADAAASHPDRALMMVWPYMDDMAFRALEAYEGDTLIFVGEGEGGCTASDEFFEKIYEMEENGWTMKYHSIPQWDGIHDYLLIARKDQ